MLHLLTAYLWLVYHKGKKQFWLNNVRNIIKKEKNTSRCIIQKIVEIITDVWGLGWGRGAIAPPRPLPLSLTSNSVMHLLPCISYYLYCVDLLPHIRYHLYYSLYCTPRCILLFFLIIFLTLLSQNCFFPLWYTNHKQAVSKGSKINKKF